MKFVLLRDGFILSGIYDTLTDAIIQKNYNNSHYEGRWEVISMKDSEMKKSLRSYLDIILKK